MTKLSLGIEFYLGQTENHQKNFLGWISPEDSLDTTNLFCSITGTTLITGVAMPWLMQLLLILTLLAMSAIKGYNEDESLYVQESMKQFLFDSKPLLLFYLISWIYKIWYVLFWGFWLKSSWSVWVLVGLRFSRVLLFFGIFVYLFGWKRIFSCYCGKDVDETTFLESQSQFDVSKSECKSEVGSRVESDAESEVKSEVGSEVDSVIMTNRGRNSVSQARSGSQVSDLESLRNSLFNVRKDKNLERQMSVKLADDVKQLDTLLEQAHDDAQRVSVIKDVELAFWLYSG